MIRFILATIFGTAVYFAWNLISWTVLPWHQSVLNTFTSEERVQESLTNYSSEDGIYILPAASVSRLNVLSPEGIAEQANNSFSAFIALKQANSRSVQQQVTASFFSSLFICMILTVLLSCTIDLSYIARVLFVTMAGTVSAAAGHLPSWNWMYFDLNYTLVMMTDVIIASFIAGLFIAVFAGRRPESESF